MARIELTRLANGIFTVPCLRTAMGPGSAVVKDTFLREIWINQPHCADGFRRWKQCRSSLHLQVTPPCY